MSCNGAMMARRFSSPAVMLARTDLMAQARALAENIRRERHPTRIEALGVRHPESTTDEANATRIMTKTFAWSLRKLGKQAPPRGWSLRIVDSTIDQPLVRYYPSSGVLEMQKRVFEVFRELDFVVVAVHELAGHHLHESTILQAGDRSYFMSDRNDTQEGCAMDCEKRLLTGPLYRTALEWKLYRLLRALEDSGITSAWDQFPEGHRMPREYVRHFVEKLPGRAQHYVFMSKDEYCGC